MRDPNATVVAGTQPFLREGVLSSNLVKAEEKRLGRKLTTEELEAFEGVGGFGEFGQVAMIPTGQIKAKAKQLSDDVIKGGPASELGGNMIVPINDLNSILTIPDFITL